MTADPFGTRPLRESALAAWAANPARFREDANAEEDHAHGYYRDRVVVELAQNAADTRGRLLLRLTGTTLVAANTGAPLTAAGVASMASLRASAKRGGGGVGRFGVGFAAVRSVSDDVVVATATGAVGFALADARADLAAAPAALAVEVAARGDALPVLRLPRPAPLPPEAVDLLPAWETVVVLRLRDQAAVAAVRAQLAAVGDPLLLALPGLSEILVEDGDPRVVRDVAERWVVATRTGDLPGHLLAARPVEERDRAGWQVTWAVPRTGDLARLAEPVIHAPTPTAEPGPRRALLLATLPLDPGRRHVVPGPVTDHVIAAAGQAWGDLLLACVRERAEGRPAPDPWSLLPRTLPGGPVDAALREAVMAASRQVPALPAAGGGLLAPAAARVLESVDDPAALAVLGARFADLAGGGHRDLVRLLDLETVALSELLPQWPDVDAAGLRELYGALTGQADLEELATVPVLLASGRVVHGARGLVMPEGVPAAALAALADLGLRVVDPAATHPLLARLGAHPAGPGDLARHPVLRAAVLADDDAAPAAAGVLLALVEAAGGPAPEPWWGDALLLAADGALVPARGLVLPGSPAARILDPAVLPPAADPSPGLAVLGVRVGLTAVRVTDAEPVEDLPGLADYLDDVGLTDDLAAGESELLAVADLDAVLDWPAALAELAGPGLRAALAPVPTRGGPVPSYVRWWLREHVAGLDHPFALPDAELPPALAAALGPVPAVAAALDPRALVALGGVGDPADLTGEAWADLLDDLVEGAPVDPWLAGAAWRALDRHAEVLADCAVLPGLTAAGLRAVTTDAVAVADPMWAGHPGVRPVIVVPAHRVAAVAEILDLDAAPERAAGRVTSRGVPVAVPPGVRALLPSLPATWDRHAPLLVDGEPVAWWVGSGIHVGEPVALATALAALAGVPAAVVADLLAGADAVAAVVALAGEAR